MNDTGTRDALPLLAFTLRRLCECFGGDGRLSVDKYESLGRLEGAIREEAERVIAVADPVLEDLDALHAAFVPTMVRINAEGGYARRRALFDDLPRRALPLLRRFVDARLLVTDRDAEGRETIEVAHEALLRTWPQLGVWLTEDQDKLRLLEGLQRAAEEWDQGGRRDDILVHRDGRLKDAEALLANPRFIVPEASVERAYLDTCRAAQDAREAAEKEEQERRIRDAERIAEEQKKTVLAQKRTTRNTRIGLVVALVLAALAGLTTFVAYDEKQAAQSSLADADYREAREKLELGKVHESLPLLAHAIRMEPAYLPGRGLLLDLLMRKNWAVPLAVFDLEGSTSYTEFSPDGALVALAFQDRTVRVWDAATGKPLTEPMRHEGEISSIEFSPDGRRLLTIDDEKTARVWDAYTGKPLIDPIGPADAGGFNPDGTRLLVFLRPTGSSDDTTRYSDVQVRDIQTGKILSQVGRVIFATFSPDGTRLLIGSEERAAQVLDASTGTPLTKPMRHAGKLSDARFSADGMRVVTASEDHTARAWDALTGKPLTEPMRHEGEVSQAQFSPDGTRILTVLGHSRSTLNASGVSTEYGPAQLWDAYTGRPVSEPIRPMGNVRIGRFSPNGARLLIVSGGATAQVWDARSGKALIEPIHPGTGGRHIWADFSPDGTQIVTYEDDGPAQVWDAQTGKPSIEPIQPEGGNSRAQLNLNGTRLYTVSNFRIGRVWDIRAGPALTEPLRHEGNIVDVQFSPDGQRLATASTEGDARIWDVKAGRTVTAPLRHYGPVTSAEFSPDGSRLVTASVDKRARVWDAHTGEMLIEPLRHEDMVISARFSPDGKRVVTGSKDHTARIWDTRSGEQLTEPLRHEGEVFDARFSPDGRRVFTSSLDKTARIWDANTGRALGKPLNFTMDSRITAEGWLAHWPFWKSFQVFSHDGKRLLIRSGNAYTNVQVWDIRSGKTLIELHDLTPNSYWLSPDGSRVVSVPIFSEIPSVWDVQTGKLLSQDIQSQNRPVALVNFGPDGDRLVTARRGGDVRIWEARTGKAMTSSLRHEGLITSARFSSDGNRLLTVTEDQTVRVWDVFITPPNDSELIASLAEVVTGQRVNEQGIVVPVPDTVERLAELRKQTKDATAADGLGKLFMRWFLADRWTRTISPLSSITVPEYIQRRIAEGRIGEASLFFHGHSLLSEIEKFEGHSPQILREGTLAPNRSNTERVTPNQSPTGVQVPEGDHPKSAEAEATSPTGTQPQPENPPVPEPASSSSNNDAKPVINK